MPLDDRLRTGLRKIADEIDPDIERGIQRSLTTRSLSPARRATTILAYAAAIGLGIAVVGIGATSLLHRIGTDPSPTPSARTVPLDTKARAGWILLEHVGDDASAGGPGAHTLWLVLADGTELHELAPGLPIDGKTNPTWSPDGKRIAFETVGPLRRVYETYASGGAPALVWQGCSGLVDGPNPCVEGSPAYSPDGDELATVDSYDGLVTNFIYIRHRYFPNDVCETPSGICFHLGYNLESTAVATATGWIENLSWSPDGTQIAYDVVARDADGNPTGSGELWLANADDRAKAHRIPLPTELVAGNPDWSPDGSLIVFNAGVAGASDIYTVQPDGSNLRRLTDDNESGAASWTYDSKILFYSQPWMWLMDADGSKAALVLSNAEAMWGAQWGEPNSWSYRGYWQPVP